MIPLDKEVLADSISQEGLVDSIRKEVIEDSISQRGYRGFH